MPTTKKNFVEKQARQEQEKEEGKKLKCEGNLSFSLWRSDFNRFYLSTSETVRNEDFLTPHWID